MTTQLTRSIRLMGVTALVAVGVAGTSDAGVSFSIGSTRSTGCGTQSVRFSVGSRGSHVSFGSHHCRPSPCQYITQRVYVPGRWECRQERRRVGHCGCYHYQTVTVRHWVPGHYRTERIHSPCCHCRRSSRGHHHGGHSSHHHSGDRHGHR